MTYTRSAATISEDGLYRYDLERWWDETLPHCLFIMLNPSTADGTEDDATIRRCVGFARKWGYGGLVVVNLFALRATDPRGLFKVPDPVGPWQALYYGRWLAKAGLAVAAWGAHGGYRGRDEEVRKLLDGYGFKLHHLGLTNGGKPKHPLYLPADTEPQLWEAK